MKLPSEIIVATENQHKGREIESILRKYLPELIVLTLADLKLKIAFPEETGLTFEENAVVKARVVAAATGKASIGDDSGLCVNALDGAPGLYSARWLGKVSAEKRNAGLIEAIESIGTSDWSADFVCVVALAFPSGIVKTAKGLSHGNIVAANRGADGFGYDPIFEVQGMGRTMAELSPEEKNRVSHRGKAIEILCRELGWSSG